jgi:uncharacterized protein YndB with AHSA1/START domain
MTGHDQDVRDGAFVIARDFDAPRDLVWKAWSEPGRMSQWWGPKGCRIRVERFEFVPGGFFHYAMLFRNGPTSWGRSMYREISPPHRIVWLNSFANERCGIARAPFSDKLPLEIENMIALSEGDGVTTLSLRALPFGESDEERQFFQDLFPSLNQGYGGTLDQLAEHLANG